jgi:sentrin-specific protease 8
LFPPNPIRLAYQSNSKQQGMAPEDPYLSYHDIRLTRADYDSIRDDWLTDNAISFWQEYLEREKMWKFPSANIVLLRPSMSHLLKLAPDQKTKEDALPKFKILGTTHIFLPVNDALNPLLAESGSHWSLLVVSLVDGVAFHYDSLGNDNRQAAQDVAWNLSKLLGMNLSFTHMQHVPQQENGKDCGVFVCMFMETLLMSRLMKVDAGRKITMSLRDEPMNAKKTRRKLLDTIDACRKEGEKRRSRSASPYRSKTPPRIGN